MTKTEFFDAIKILSDSLPTPHQEKRIFALYEFFAQTPLEILKASARKAARELDRFPTPAIFGKIIQGLTPISPEASMKKLCPVCDGYGKIRLGLQIFSAACAHGSALPTFKRAPVDSGAIQEILNAQKGVYDEIYGSGYWDQRVNAMGGPTDVYPQKRSLTEAEVYDLLLRDPVKHLRGFKKIRKWMKSSSPRLYGLYQKFLPELIGKDHVRKLWKEIPE